MQKKKRKKSHGFDQKGERTPPPTALKEINEADGVHNGLRACMATAHALAEISRAKLHSRDIDIDEACARVERNPFAWQKTIANEWSFFGGKQKPTAFGCTT